MPFIDVLALGELPDAADPRWQAWLTARELETCREFARAEEHLAARLVGKLALARELGLSWPPSWLDLEIGLQRLRPPTVACCGAPLAATLSLSHGGGFAAGLAWATR
jgi:phosphopantetheinyl transferase (holo-ACP synthase)